MSIISETIQITRGEDRDLNVTMSPVIDVSSWNFVLTIRENPDYPLRGSDTAIGQRDFDTNSWDIVYTNSSFVDTDMENGEFSFELPATATDDLEIGSKRYVFDIWRTDSGSHYSVVAAQWIDILPNVKQL